MQADAAATAAEVPGLVIRPYAGESDVQSLVRVYNAEYEADDIEERLNVAGERQWLAHPSEHFEPARDVLIAELDGEVVGVAHQSWVDTRDGRLREHRLDGAVHPAYRRRGIGTALLAENERRARALASNHATERPRAYAAFAAEGRPAAHLLALEGYEVARWFFEMVRPTLDDVEDIPLSEGLELRSVSKEMYPVLWRANREAFRDHWGGSDESEAAMRRFLEAPEADPSLWLIAWDGDDIAGGVINGVFREQNEALGLQRGWLDSVFTRRPWRRRGLARALIAQSLILLRERGMTSAALGVDADNAQGALGLYERAGFEVQQRHNAWRKPMDLEPG